MDATQLAHYTEAEANGFLATALKYHSERSVLEYTVPRKRGSPHYYHFLTRASFWPRHSYRVEGLDPDERVFRNYAAHWFSLPLLSRNNHHAFEHLQTQVEDGSTVLSLDMIRFDRFHIRSVGGFWLPTAIVRPYFVPRSKLLKFRVVYEYETSPAKYQANHLEGGEGFAKDSLRRVLREKQEVWLAQLEPLEAMLLAEMWAKAPGSPLLMERPFFISADQSAGDLTAGSSAGEASTAGAAIPDLNHPAVGHGSSESDEEEARLAQHALTQHPPDQHVQQVNRMPPVAFVTPELAAPERVSTVPVEHHGANSWLSVQPLRPQPRYPWQAGHLPGVNPSYADAFDRHARPDLDQTLAPSRSSRRLM